MDVTVLPTSLLRCQVSATDATFFCFTRASKRNLLMHFHVKLPTNLHDNHLLPVRPGLLCPCCASLPQEQGNHDNLKDERASAGVVGTDQTKDEDLGKMLFQSRKRWQKRDPS